jgi:16S rRNA (guanine527-N7)-methyltransferase
VPSPTDGWLFFLAAEQARCVAPEPPAAASQVFGASLPAARRYAELLAGPGVVRGLIGPGEAPILWERHLLNCAVVAELVPQPGALVDIGSGAGLPGLVLAMLLPGVRVTLLEPLARRTAFLEECLAELRLPNATVCRGRAEELVGQLAADVVTARAVAPLPRLAGLAAGLLSAGGVVLAIKGANAAAELAAAKPALWALGVGDAEVVTVGDGVLATPARVVRFRVAPRRGLGGPSGRARSAPGAGIVLPRGADGATPRQRRARGQRGGGR